MFAQRLQVQVYAEHILGKHLFNIKELCLHAFTILHWKRIKSMCYARDTCSRENSAWNQCFEIDETEPLHDLHIETQKHVHKQDISS